MTGSRGRVVSGGGRGTIHTDSQTHMQTDAHRETDNERQTRKDGKADTDTDTDTEILRKGQKRRYIKKR